MFQNFFSYYYNPHYNYYGFRLLLVVVSKYLKLSPLVEGDPKAPFSIATTPRCRRRALFLSLDCSTLPLIRTLYCWVLSKDVSSTIFKVFGMTRPGIEPRSPGPLVNTLPTRPMSRFSSSSSSNTTTTIIIELKIIIIIITNYSSWWVFPGGVSWSFPGVWATARLLKSLGLLSVFWPILTIL